MGSAPANRAPALQKVMTITCLLHGGSEDIQTGPEQIFHGSFRSKTKTLDLQEGVMQLNRADPSESFACTSHLHPAQARLPLERAPSRSFCASPTDAHKDAAPSPSVPT